MMLRALALSAILAPALLPAQEAKPALRDIRGNRRSLSEFKEAKAFALFFVGVDCPMANLYVPRLLELHQAWAPKGVRFVAVYPNEAETLEAVAIHSDEKGFPFLVVKDYGQRLADKLGVQRTPEAVVLDKDHAVKYRGRIDDQYGAAFRKEKATSNDLADALEAVLAGQALNAAAVEADGCLIGRKSALPRKDGVTWARDVAPIVQKRCQACHRPGEIGPIPLVSYEDAAGHAAMIREVVVQKRMPPWHADPRHGKFSNDRSLAADEIATIASWIDSGSPQGDPKDLPKPVEWPKGWAIGTPDAVFSLPRDVDVPAQGTVEYLYFNVPTGFAEDRWVERAEIRPGNARVVHHVLVYLKLPGKGVHALDGSTTALVGWAPGDMPFIVSPGTAARIPREAELQFEVHYTPIGAATKDRTSVGLIFAKKPPERETRMNIFAKLAIAIVPGAGHHQEQSTMTFREDVRILTLMPHMHVRGKSYKYEAIWPDGKTEMLLSVPRWDFNWQSVYRFETPVSLPRGSKIRQTAHWDNSDNNPLNPDPSKKVRWGLQTWEEMFNGWVQYVPEKPAR